MTSTPYKDAAERYLELGWDPLPVPGKWPPPEGFTGANGRKVTPADVARWVKSDGSKNVALRLPPDVAAFDVDAAKVGTQVEGAEGVGLRVEVLPGVPGVEDPARPVDLADRVGHGLRR